MLKSDNTSIKNFLLKSMVILIIIITTVIEGNNIIRQYRNFLRETEVLKLEDIEHQKKSLENQMNEVFEYIEFEKNNTYKLLKENPKYTDEQIEQIIKQRVKEFVSRIHFGYNDEQYIFIMTYDGIELANGKYLELVGKDMLEIKDADGVKVSQRLIKSAKENEYGVYLTQKWIKDTDNLDHDKLYFAKPVPEWEWVIGSGVYIDDIEENIKKNESVLKKQFEKEIKIVAILMIIIMLIATICIKSINDKINKKIEFVVSFFERASKERIYIDIEELRYTELKRMAASVNNMIKDRYDIENKINKMNIQLKELSITDGLTGLYNHKHICQILKKEIQKSCILKSDLSIIMIDIDHFKKINDNYGHQFGDDVLVEISKYIKKYIDKNGFVGRYGGEEFLIVLPNSNIENTYKKAEKIRNGIKNIRFNNKDAVVTISGGAVQFKEESSKDIVNKADNLLYKAKENGRDRIERGT
ncbi:sensor domain-containing diguanylate cyclase [Tepidibacter aestuarii]|uniref:sensor domain-containing diguanylate cyclase n=1 Tax=Tepidibacter aestuarii TaxID=2925782 RepID=UPI0020BD5AB7|nr:diguanylate cyclase [Tepidibacter aestuarii]CAH2214889.1 GGDEF domain-containing protein [Tepidibacter aestuarii]